MFICIGLPKLRAANAELQRMPHRRGRRRSGHYWYCSLEREGKQATLPHCLSSDESGAGSVSTPLTWAIDQLGGEKPVRCSSH